MAISNSDSKVLESSKIFPFCYLELLTCLRSLTIFHTALLVLLNFHSDLLSISCVLFNIPFLNSLNNSWKISINQFPDKDPSFFKKVGTSINHKNKKASVLSGFGGIQKPHSQKSGTFWPPSPIVVKRGFLLNPPSKPRGFLVDPPKYEVRNQTLFFKKSEQKLSICV